MSGYRFKLLLLINIGLMITQAVDAADPDNPAENNSVQDSQQQAIQDNLVD